MAAGIVNNCTIIRNYCAQQAIVGRSGDGGGICSYGGGITNCIIWNNLAASSNNDMSTGAVVRAVYSCSPDLVSGVGNIILDPKFINSGTNCGLTTIAGDYHLQEGISPCINTGTNILPWARAAADLDGRCRLVQGAEDMGAYEFPPYYGTIITVR